MDNTLKLSESLQLIANQMKTALQSERRQIAVSSDIIDYMSKAIEYIKRFETP